MNRFALVLFTSVAAVGSASAADLAPRAAEPVAPAYLPYSWAGFYLGGQVGGAWLHSNTVGAGGAGPLPAFTTDGNGVVFGGQLGYNYQYNQFVFGLEGDFAGSTAKGNSQCSIAPATVCQTSQDFLGSVRGRLGYAWDRFLVYGDGGVAFGDDTFKQTVGTPRTLANGTRTGWTAGLGAEYAFTDHWSAAVEWNYYDFGKKSVPTPGPGTLTTGDTENVVVAKINYHF